MLQDFYRRVRPQDACEWVRKSLQQDVPVQPNRDFGRDLVNVLVGIIWLTDLTVIGINFVLQDYRSLGLALLMVLATPVLLKFNWFDD